MRDVLDINADTVAFAMLWAAYIGSLILSISYGVFFRWYKTVAGRAFMQVLLSLSLLLTSTIVTRTTGDIGLVDDIIKIGAYVWITVSTIQVAVVLWKGWWARDPYLVSAPTRVRPETNSIDLTTK